MDVFVHSWHDPGFGAEIDSVYANHSLRASLHQPVTALPKAASQSLSIGRAASLALAHA